MSRKIYYESVVASFNIPFRISEHRSEHHRRITSLLNQTNDIWIYFSVRQRILLDNTEFLYVILLIPNRDKVYDALYPPALHSLFISECELWETLE